MYQAFRILFCILAVILSAAVVFIFIFAGNLWGIATVILIVTFTALTFVFKQLQEKQELKKNPPPPQGDFITGSRDVENK